MKMKKMNSISDSPNLMTVAQLTELIWGEKNSANYQRTLDHLVKNNIIPSLKIGKRYFVKRKDAEIWLNSAHRGTSK